MIMCKISDPNFESRQAVFYDDHHIRIFRSDVEILIHALRYFRDYLASGYGDLISIEHITYLLNLLKLSFQFDDESFVLHDDIF